MKYYLYLYFINCNRNIYKKTDYLFSDFSSEHTAPGEAYLIFKEMFKQNLSVHYLTKREDIFKEYMALSRNNSSYIPIIFDSNYINGNFLEKYFDLMLRLKIVVSGAKIYSINNLFYNLEYITFICLTHGISYLKDFLYENYYSNKIYNKIVLPPSNLIISNAKKFGWEDKDIIRIGLPRWDLFNYYEKNINVFYEKENNKKKSIFIMFTWRELKKNKKISNYYFKNIINLITNKLLNKVLKQNNITLYYSLHHMIEEFKYLFNSYKYIKYISQEKIIECLNKSDLIITDFSSIIFDIMVRNKPYIIFIPDSEDNNLSNIYTEAYCNIIKCLKNGTINFKNRYFSINSTVKKIIYYINNNFIIDNSLKKFYDKFNLSSGNNIKGFIMYLKNIK
jgi:CDP-glycerol glycerophosphotransferase (TagB/SpsB family)